MTTVLLVHGGLWEDMDADRFWVRPGVVAGLRGRGLVVLAPDRMVKARSWAAEVDHIAAGLPDGPLVVVAGSNGCSVAALLALRLPGKVRGLVLAWPATARDARVDAWTREGMRAAGAGAATCDALLAGATVRGLSDVDLAGIAVPVGVLPSEPDNPFHQRRTVDALLRLVPRAVELAGCPEPPRPEFPDHLPAFLATVERFAATVDPADR
jgi:pimeloyl-ACP methyl ester carboxylesterase